MEIKPAVQANNINPVMPTEVPEDIKKTTFSLDEGLLSGNPDITTIKVDGQKVEQTTEGEGEKKVSEVKGGDEKVVEGKKELEEKKEVKKDEPVLKAPREDTTVSKTETTLPKTETTKKTDGDKKSIKAITPVKDTSNDTFDYSKFAPQEVVNLKNMSRQSREYTAKLIEDNKKLSSLKDASYLQHEQAYTLSPDFQQLRSKQQLASVEGQCWEQALINIKTGKKYREITGFDNHGQPVFSDERTATTQDEIRIQNNILACQQAEQQVGNQLSSFTNEFKQRVQTDLSAINNEQKQRFAWVSDPKLLDYTLETDSGEKKVRDVINDFKSIWPVYMSNTPAVDVAANLFVALQIQGAELKKAQAEGRREEIKQEEDRKVEPTSSHSSVEEKSATKGIPRTFSMEGMPTR